MTAPMIETDNDIAAYVWRTKYRAAGETCVADTQMRVARALAVVEPDRAEEWAARFASLLADFKFIPGGRILAGAGLGKTVTLFNCFVMGEIEDSIPGIFRALQESALTMQQGGGVGLDFSTLRPLGAHGREHWRRRLGPGLFMSLWDAMCETMLSTGARRGAMMGTSGATTPTSRPSSTPSAGLGALTHFNLSVQITDPFMEAVRADTSWTLTFPGAPTRVIRARGLWDRILRAAYDCAEPGRPLHRPDQPRQSLAYCEQIGATNPCGEVPLPPYGACDLGSLNLTSFVRDAVHARGAARPGGAGRRLPHRGPPAGQRDRRLALSLAAAAEAAPRARRIGLGLTGLADALVMLGLAYGSGQGRERRRGHAADLRRCLPRFGRPRPEKGPFPASRPDAYLAAPFIRACRTTSARDRRAGVRNSHLLAIAPAGTISLLAGNVSSGLEPIFAGAYSRRVLNETASPDRSTCRLRP